MSLLADLINKEKNRRIVTDIFSSDTSASVTRVTPSSDKTLNEQLLKLEIAIFEEAKIDTAHSEAIILELEAIARSL